MGLFKNMFGSSASASEPVSNVNWIALEDESQLDLIDEQSKTNAVLIFKHSTRCSISRFALKDFNNTYDIPAKDLTVYMLDLLNYRTISNALAQKYSVEHQSPQVLLIKEGVCTYSVTHDSIDAQALKDEL